MSNISHGIILEMNQLHRYHTPARKALDKLLRSTDSHRDWVPEQGSDLLYDTGPGLIATSATMGSFPQAGSMT
jgi:hypothetical protein